MRLYVNKETVPEGDYFLVYELKENMYILLQHSVKFKHIL